MGFLLGAFGKLAAGQRMRNIQSRMMRVQARLRRASRDVSDMEKMIDRQEKAALNSLTAQSNAAMNLAKSGLMSSIFGAGNASAIMTKVQNGSQLSTEESNSYSALMSQYNQQVSNMSATCETSAAMQKQQIQDYFEQVREMQLNPLKDEEDLLQSEQDSLKTQLETASADYKACQDMEKNDAKLLAPSYTAGG